MLLLVLLPCFLASLALPSLTLAKVLVQGQAPALVQGQAQVQAQAQALVQVQVQAQAQAQVVALAVHALVVHALVVAHARTRYFFSSIDTHFGGVTSGWNPKSSPTTF